MIEEEEDKKMLMYLKQVIDDGFKKHEIRETEQIETQITLITNKIIAQHEASPAHLFIEEMIAREKRNQERRERIQGNFFFYLLVVSTGAIGTAIWTTFFKK